MRAEQSRAEQSRAEQSRAEQSRAEQSRENWIDVIKAICMIFIVMSHLPYCPKILRHFLTPFFLTGFYFASGYVMKPLTIRKFAIKKVKTILWPWLIFSAIEIVMISKFGNHETTIVGYMLYTLLQVKDLHESLWFFPSLFLTLVFADFLILRLNGKTLAWVSCGMLLGSRLYGMFMPSNLLPWNSVCLPWHLHNVGTTVFFVILGYLYRKHQVNKKIKKYMPIISIMCISLYLIELYITRNTIEIGIWNYTELLEWFLIMGTGLAMVITVSQSKRLNNSRVLSYIGQNTLLYYALHQNICRVIEHLIDRWDWGYRFSQTLVGQWIFTIIFASFILLILVIPIEFIKRKMKYLTRFVW